MAVSLEPEVRENPQAINQPVPPSAAAAEQDRRPVLVAAWFAPDPGAAVSPAEEPEDRVRTARGILFGLAISIAAWVCAALIWWAI